MNRKNSKAPSCRIAVKVTPNARAAEIRGSVGGVLQVRVKAPPVDGKANEALIRFIAERLSVPRSSVALVRGDSSRQKLLEIAGLDRDEVIARLVS